MLHASTYCSQLFSKPAHQNFPTVAATTSHGRQSLPRKYITVGWVKVCRAVGKSQVLQASSHQLFYWVLMGFGDARTILHVHVQTSEVGTGKNHCRGWRWLQALTASWQEVTLPGQGQQGILRSSYWAQNFGSALGSASNGEPCLMVIQYDQRDDPDQSAGFECDTTCDPEGYKQWIYVFSSSSVWRFMLPKHSNFQVVKKIPCL